MEELPNKICTISNLTAETIKSYSKLSDVVAARVLFCQEAVKLGV